jgi:hypothetical protein
MPTIDVPTQRSSEGKEGFGTGIPTPLLLIAIGGGIGLIVFLSRRSSATDESGEGTLLPNTAIMLGSLQQSMLDLQGLVSTGDADLSSQLSGIGTNLGLQIDMQTGQINQGFADLSTYLQGSLGTLQGNQDALASAISGLGTQNQSLADSLAAILGTQTQLAQNIGTIQTGMAGLQGSYTDVQGAINNILNVQSQQGSVLNQLGQAIAQLPATTGSQQNLPIMLAPFEGKFFRFQNDATVWTVHQGQLWGVNETVFDWDWSKVMVLSDVTAEGKQNLLSVHKGYRTSKWF